jgi:hypothetical protein
MGIPNSVLSTTLQILRDRLIDNSFISHPLFRAMDAAGNVKRVSGGQRIEQPVILGKHSSVTNLSNGYEPVSLAVTDPFRKAIFEWSTFTAPVVMTDVEQLANKGELAIVPILESKVKNVMIDLKQQMSERIFVGGGAIPAPLQTLNGMGSASLAADTTGWFESAAFGSQTANSVGGLSKNAYKNDNWQNQVKNSGAAFDINHLDELSIACSLYHPQGKRPDICFLSQKAYAKFLSQVTDLTRFINVSDQKSLSNDMAAEWRGMKIYVDPRLGFANAAGVPVSGYVISSDMMEMYFDTDAEFQLGEMVPVPGTATYAARALVRTNLITGSLATHGVLLNAEA